MVGRVRAAVDRGRQPRLDRPATGMPGGTATPVAGARSAGRRPSGRTASSRSARTSAAIASRSRSRRTCRTCSGSPSRCRPRRRADALPGAGARPAQPALVPALSIRFGNDFRVGFAPGFLFSTGRLMFAEDLALDGGSAGLNSDCMRRPVRRREPARGRPLRRVVGPRPRRREVLGDAGRGHLLPPPLVRARASRTRAARWAATSRASRSPASAPRSRCRRAIRAAAARSTARTGSRPAASSATSPTSCPTSGSPARPGGSRPGLELSAMVRWLWLPMHDRSTSACRARRSTATGNLPQHIVLYRGFKDVWDTRVRVSYWWRERVRVGAMLRVETSAVDDRRGQRRRGRRAEGAARRR